VSARPTDSSTRTESSAIHTPAPNECAAGGPRFGPDAQGLVDYARSLDCIHCGLCLRTCPTYQLSGRESASPRGRIHLMRAIAEDRLTPTPEVREELDFCLVCRHCESVCPAGVEFGAMMEHTRGALESTEPRGFLVRFARHVGFRWILPSRFGLRIAATKLGLAQKLGLVKLAARLQGARGAMLKHMPLVPPWSERKLLPVHTPARGARIGTALVLEGCVMPELFGRVNHATARVLAAVGYDVVKAQGHVCCGALHAHNGDLEGARMLARSTVERFEAAAPLDAPIVVNSAGCGSHLKELGRILEHDEAFAPRACALAARVVDFSQLLGRTDVLARLKPQLHAVDLGGRVTWDDPCHLCHGQQVRAEPRKLLESVPDLVRVELADAESCCGSAGIYSLLRPLDSLAILDTKLEDLRRSGAKVLVTGNPGCHQQWQTGVARAGLGVRVMHIAEVLDMALQANAAAPAPRITVTGPAG
jgi:glycolate oxidase iron-sulfur subunit